MASDGPIVGNRQGAVPETDRLLIPVRMVNEVLYCERLAALEFRDGLFRDNAFTVEGRRRHRAVDRSGGDLPESHRTEETTDQGPVARSLWLCSEALGITGKIDVVEARDGSLVPVEFKRGSLPPRREAWLPERAQVCAQALLLRDLGHRCDKGQIAYLGSGSRIDVPITDELVSTSLRAIQRARELLESDALPPPLEDSPKCPACSLVSICLPDETLRLRPAPGRGPRRRRAPRTIAVRHEPGSPLYVTEHGARVVKKGQELEVLKNGDVLARKPLLHTSQVSLFANASVTCSATRALVHMGIPICHFTSGGWFDAITHGFPAHNVQLRLRQYRASEDPARRLTLARGFVHAKIRNCITLLRRNARDRDAVRAALSDMKKTALDARSAPSEAALLGLEGAAARAYFGAFHHLLRPPSPGSVETFSFHNRNRRPPRDPVNALLSFVYSLLVKDLAAATLAVGLEPALGFYHHPRPRRPALALDLAEEFRPLVADSVVIQVVNNGEVRPAHFIQRASWCNLTAHGRRAVLAAYERRLDIEVRHPVFRYRVSYRRLFELQARILALAIRDEIPTYLPFMTR